MQFPVYDNIYVDIYKKIEFFMSSLRMRSGPKNT